MRHVKPDARCCVMPGPRIGLRSFSIFFAVEYSEKKNEKKIELDCKETRSRYFDYFN